MVARKKKLSYSTSSLEKIVGSFIYKTKQKKRSLLKNPETGIKTTKEKSGIDGCYVPGLYILFFPMVYATVLLIFAPYF